MVRRRRLQATVPSASNKRKIERVTRILAPPARVFLVSMAPLGERGASNIPDGPALVLSNHVSLLDPLFTITAGAKPIHWLATAAAMQQPLMGRVLQAWGSVPKKKFTVDPTAIRTLKRWLDLGALVGSYPEGERSWDGELLPLLPGIESLVRLLKVPILPVRVLNASRVLPRWAEVRRRGPVTVEYGQPRKFERKAPPAEVRKWIAEQLYVDPEDESLHAPVHSRGKLAHGLENPLFRCMQCFAWDALRPSGDEIRCGHCRATWRVDTRNHLTGLHADAASMSIIHARAKIRARNNEDFFVDASRFERDGFIAASEAGQLLDVTGHKAKPLSRGRLELDTRALRVVDAAGSDALHLPLDEIVIAAVELRRRLTFRTKDDVLYEFVLPTESPLKWSELVEHWRQAALASSAEAHP